MPRVSDQLSELSKRVKSAEDTVDAAKAETREQLTVRVERARTDAEQRAIDLRASGDAALQDVADWWKDIQVRWKDHVRTLRQEAQGVRDEYNASRAHRRAEQAEASADFAIAFAMAAIDEAEYAVLDATLARAEANDVTV
jgi:hypothetical protein